MTVKLFEIDGDIAKPTALCYQVPYLKDIIDEYGENAIKIFRFFHYMWDLNPATNPYVNLAEEEKIEVITRNICPDIDIDDQLIKEGLELVGKLYETETYRIYKGFKRAMDKLATQISFVQISLYKDDGNAGEVDKAVRLYDNLKARLKESYQDLMDEMNVVNARGGGRRAYDIGENIELE